MKSATPSSPLVSVIIPAYNAEAFIERTLTSVLSQTYQNLEVLVIDDGSTDCTPELIQKIAQRDRRVRLLWQSNAGVAAARNLGIQHAKGEFIAPIDADDIWYPHNLERQVQCFLKSKASVGLVYSWSADIDEFDQLTGGVRISRIQGRTFKTLICHNFIGNASATLIRRTCFDTVGGYTTKLRVQNAEGCEDWELYLRIAERYEFRVVPEFLVGYRKASSSMSGDFHKMARSHALMLRSVQHKHPGIPFFFYRLSQSSFYMYLSRQSSCYGNHAGSLFWLRQALKADCITPWGRYGLYILSLKSIWGVLVNRFRSQKGVNQNLNSSKNLSPHRSLATNNDSPTNRDSFHVKFTLLIGNVLHRLLAI